MSHVPPSCITVPERPAGLTWQSACLVQAYATYTSMYVYSETVIQATGSQEFTDAPMAALQIGPLKVFSGLDPPEPL